MSLDPSTYINEALDFSAVVTGTTFLSDMMLSWSLLQPDGGSLTVSGNTQSAIYHAPGIAGTYPMQVTPLANPGKAQSVNIHVYNPVAMLLDPLGVTIPANGGQVFTITYSGRGPSSGDYVSWEVAPATAGAITPIGNGTRATFTPTTGDDKTLYPVTATIVATSTVDSRKSLEAKVVVSKNISISTTPSLAYVGTNGTVYINANVSGFVWPQSSSIHWAIRGGYDNGSLTGVGGTGSTAVIYNAPAKPGTYLVDAISNEDSRLFATVQVIVR